MTRLAGLCLTLVASASSAQALASARGQWMLNSGAEHSQVLGTGALLGAGQFRVGLHTHFLLEEASVFSLREHVTGAWAPLDWLQLFAQVPVVLLQRPGELPVGVGRPFVGARVGILNASHGDPLWLSVEGHVGIPGLEQAELPSRSLLPSGVVNAALGVPLGEFAAFGVQTGARFGEQLVELHGGFTFAGRPDRDSKGVHFGGELTAQGWLSLLNGVRGFVEVLGGVRYRLRPLELSFLAGPGYGLSSGFSGRAVFGLSFVNPSPPKESEPPRVAKADCTDGTPYPIEKCPELDWDHDGVVNGKDACVKEPGEKDNAGCPWPDADGDGVEDRFDNCIPKPGPASNAGCPREEPQKVVIRRDRLEILEVIYFEFDKAVIRPESFELLEQVAAVLASHPEISHVRIEGHTDQVGGADYNRQLSLARANAVKAFLVERGGIAGERLTTRGYGFDRPVASNDDEQGRAQNRRVEFLLRLEPNEESPAPDVPNE